MRLALEAVIMSLKQLWLITKDSNPKDTNLKFTDQSQILDRDLDKDPMLILLKIPRTHHPQMINFPNLIKVKDVTSLLKTIHSMVPCTPHKRKRLPTKKITRIIISITILRNLEN